MKLSVPSEEIPRLFSPLNIDVVYRDKHFTISKLGISADAYFYANKDSVGFRVPLSSIKAPVIGNLGSKVAWGKLQKEIQDRAPFLNVSSDETDGFITISTTYVVQNYHLRLKAITTLDTGIELVLEPAC